MGCRKKESEVNCCSLVWGTTSLCPLLDSMLPVKLASLKDAGCLLLTAFTCHPLDLEFCLSPSFEN